VKLLAIGFAVCIAGSAVWTAWETPVRADNQPVGSEPCVTAMASDVDDLEKQRLGLEQAVATSKLQVDNLASTDGASERLERAKQDLQANQTLLIEFLYKIECSRPDMERTDEVLRGTPAVLTMSLFYATNRRPTGSTQLENFYGTDDTRTLAYGTTTVSLPSSHKPGELELPSLWKLEWKSNPERHFQVKAVTPLDLAEARNLIGSNLSNARAKSLLIFVHGYNVNFVEASYRTAQLAYDLRFRGLAMFYSWPSAGSVGGYLHDEESAQLAKTTFDQMLDEISSLPFQDIYIVAHSMGNRLVGGALADRVRDKKDVGKIREIMLAAPDINVEIFKSEIAPGLAQLMTARKTIYASSSDVALKASNVIHGFPRVGDTKVGVFVYPGFDTIDATGAAPLMRSFGHSYVLDSTVVLNDVEDVIMWRRPLTDRILRPLGVDPNLYWGLR
jgi:esterase/lipase superfamily enzyme